MAAFDRTIIARETRLYFRDVYDHVVRIHESIDTMRELLTSALDSAGNKALLVGTRTILDANVPLRKKVPISLGLRDALQSAKKGEVPDLGKPFDDAGAGSSDNVRHAKDSLVNALQSVLTRGFRSSFALSALFALLALVPALRLRRAS